ncbi:NUDIX domain-containing protein [Chloroflexi bacterium TSY]|nr:NUDIX domain-containing protein [Chloroflexi bacterium TSY]
MSQIFYIVNVQAAIYHQGRYLMIKRGLDENYLAGVWDLPGGKVEDAGNLPNVLEETVRREVKEEVSLELLEPPIYVESAAFVANEKSVINVVFLCRAKNQEAEIGSPAEVAAIRWMSTEDVLTHSNIQPWTKEYVRHAEEVRIAKRWA